MPFDDDAHPVWKTPHFRRALDAAGVSLWYWSIAGDTLAMDSQGFALWGIAPAARVNFEDLSAKIHPSDRDRVRAAFIATRTIVGPYEIDFRILKGDEVRWVSARGVGSDEGLFEGQMAGVFLDVTGRKQAEEGHELLAGEMSHRVKNLLSIATSLTHLTSRATTSAKDMAQELTARLAALGRAHDVVRPLPGGQGRAALLGDLLSVLLAPYDDTTAFSGRIRVAVPRMGVGDQAATTLALIVHELATNSVKYGALSAEAGTLDISGAAEDELVSLIWTEHGGPTVDTAAANTGYGRRMLERSVGGLGGTLSTESLPDGVVVTIKLDAARLVA